LPHDYLTQQIQEEKPISFPDEDWLLAVPATHDVVNAAWNE
jgi:hypothetical protein